jgi:hypothetical protein
MDSPNANDFVVEDNLDGISFSGISTIGVDIGKINEKMQKMEVNNSTNFY